MTILVSHQVVTPHFTTKLRPWVAAEAVVGRGSVKALREMQTYKKQKIIHQDVCFCSATMLTSKIITESVENHSECCGCVNSCNKLV